MRKKEILILGLILILILLVTIFGHTFTIPLFIGIFVLAGFYVIGGFHLFNYSDNLAKLSIIAGIILGLSVGTLMFILLLPVSILVRIIVLINIAFSIILISWGFLNKKKVNRGFKYLVFRSLIIALVTSFFSFSNVYDKAYRNVLLRMVSPDQGLSKNLLMFDKINAYNTFIDNEDYENAIIVAKQGIEYGKQWRNYDTLYYQDFSGAYEFLAEAYKKLGHRFYDKKDYENALVNYIRADSVFAHEEHVPKYPENNKSDIYWNRYNLLLTYSRLGRDEDFDRELDYLLEYYDAVKDSIDMDYYSIMETTSRNYYNRGFYSDAININKYALEVLTTDSINNQQEYKNTYIELIKNYIFTDSLDNAQIFLDKYERIASNKDCRYLFFNTQLLQQKDIKKAREFAIKSCECFGTKENYNNTFAANFLLAKSELENSSNANFEKQIQLVQELALKTTNKEYNISGVNQVLGHYHYIKGNYSESNKYYKNALEYYGNNDDETKTLIELKLAQIRSELDLPYDIKAVNNNVLNLLSEYEYILPNITIFHNGVGNLNTGLNSKLSDSLFNSTISCHNAYKIQNSPKIGIAINGLGINELYRKNYKAADSLFLKAINQLNKFYGEDQNVNQLISYLNIAESKINQRKFIEASNYLKKANIVKTHCFNSEQTIYDAYILNLEGDTIKGSGENDDLLLDKYKKALEVAKDYFDDEHSFIKTLEFKIN